MRGLLVFSCLWTALLLQCARGNWDEYEKLMFSYQNDNSLRQQWNLHAKKFYQDKTDLPPQSAQLNCESSKSGVIPTSVNALLPGDIKVVAALGDSITAGNGILAVTPVDILFQDRAHSFSIGGYASYDEGVITLPNILRLQNKALYGYSTDGGDVDSEEAKFNVAIPGSTAPDMPEQANMLIQRMQQDPNVNYDEDWKMVTIFVGGNDLCRVCIDEEQFGSAAYLNNLRTTIQRFSSRLPRAFINVMPIMDITPLVQIADGPICDAIQNIACPCATDQSKRPMLQKIQKEYSSFTEEMIKSKVFDKEDFTVVFHPFLRDAKPPTDANGVADVSYFAPDCFHFSEKGHKALAVNLWNSLFQAVGQKTTNITFKETPQCPPKGTFLKTNKNSAPTNYYNHGPLGATYLSSGQAVTNVGLVTAVALIGAFCSTLIYTV